MLLFVLYVLERREVKERDDECGTDNNSCFDDFGKSVVDALCAFEQVSLYHDSL